MPTTVKKTFSVFTERRSDLEEEKRLEQEEKTETFSQRFHDLKDSHEMNAGNFAELLRSSTLRRMMKISDWKRPKVWCAALVLYTLTLTLTSTKTMV